MTLLNAPGSGGVRVLVSVAKPLYADRRIALR